jgi:hypothetical protein
MLKGVVFMTLEKPKIIKEIEEINSSLAEVPKFQTAGGTGIAITLTGITLVTGFSKTFIASANNNGTATTINGKPIYKPNTTTAPNIISGKAYTVWYNATSSCFFIKASAEGNVTADKVLAGYTFSNDNDTGLVGTIDLSQLTADNVRKDVNINGIIGNKLQYGVGDNIGELDMKQFSSYNYIVSGSLAKGTDVAYCCVDDAKNIYYCNYSGYLMKITPARITSFVTNIGDVNTGLRYNGGFLYASSNSLGLRKYKLDGSLVWSNPALLGVTLNKNIFDDSYIYGVKNGDIIKINKMTGLEVIRAIGVIGISYSNGTISYSTPATIDNGRIYFPNKATLRGVASLDTSTLSNLVSHGTFGTSNDRVIAIESYKGTLYLVIRPNDFPYFIGNIFIYTIINNSLNLIKATSVGMASDLLPTKNGLFYLTGSYNAPTLSRYIQSSDASVQYWTTTTDNGEGYDNKSLDGNVNVFGFIQRSYGQYLFYAYQIDVGYTLI